MEYAIGAVAAALLLLLIANLKPHTKTIDREIGHLYSVSDPQFARALGSLLGPALLPGNRVTALCNGDEIFPAMLGAIAAAKTLDRLRDLHLLVGLHRQGLRRALSASAPAPA